MNEAFGAQIVEALDTQGGLGFAALVGGAGKDPSQSRRQGEAGAVLDQDALEGGQGCEIGTGDVAGDGGFQAMMKERDCGLLKALVKSLFTEGGCGSHAQEHGLMAQTGSSQQGKGHGREQEGPQVELARSASEEAAETGDLKETIGAEKGIEQSV
jgi:hypothetical protein